jgi:hypothetical protein
MNHGHVFRSCLSTRGAYDLWRFHDANASRSDSDIVLSLHIAPARADSTPL